MGMGDWVNVARGVVPKDYHCRCEFCTKVIGNLVQEDGKPYSRLERNRYYSPTERGEGGHIAKTPLHIARWAIQEYTEEGDWVLDPTIGAGTTAVEALTQRRNVAGMELQFSKTLEENVQRHSSENAAAVLRIGDAREIRGFLDEESVPRPRLVINNPPYSGDEGTDKRKKDGTTRRFHYSDDLPNLAFLDEGKEYWDTIRSIYRECALHLLPGGHFVVAVKDMMRNKEPFLLHLDLCRVLVEIGLSFVGTAFLHHYPRTLFMNTYYDKYGVHPPYYQTISVFRKMRKIT